jgi:hypothetical protein
MSTMTAAEALAILGDDEAALAMVALFISILLERQRRSKKTLK